MSKIYKLVIPDLVPKDMINKAYELKHFDGNILQLSATGGFLIIKDNSGRSLPYGCESFPKDWLQEIKQPMTAKESWEERVVSNHYSYFRPGHTVKDGYVLGFEHGEENERLKHELKQTLDEFEQTVEEMNGENCQRCWIQGIRKGWKACEKNRGFDN